MISEIPYVIMIMGAVLVGLYLANYFYDKGVEQYVSRKVGHGVGGMGYLLLALLFREPWWPLIISGAFALLLALSRIIKPDAFRGVGGTGRKHALAEIHFPIAGTVSLAVGWAWLGNPWLAVVPCLFMAWGDLVTGLIRSRFYGKEVKGDLGSVGMIVVCLLVGYFFHPYWIAVLGAVVATLAERFTPLSHGWIDDNWTIIASSLLVMGVLNAYFG